ncbi:hypothetical protein [Pyrobaculum neutrophilum]|uniref:Uncharacterized protein n=1 Tax=Pyrobaculum neutrophilum (strain DSM 2338 / JCM 9278 / NBRC 100436 / V24Sta) TaxID=444157 RepID=B1YDB0_PYRNV|nr:hypothetical protein [Pyrobaculum neutrophilum]ACB39773.1 conserved hypothetical protein [Pyrobaculum neutrophilum V24Sta]
MRTTALLLLAALLATAGYIDRASISLRQCLCMAPQWLYLDVYAHVWGPPADIKLYWYDGGWRGPCDVGRGVEAYNICSVPYGASAVALALYEGGREVDRIEVWGVKPGNYTCSAAPDLRVLNRTTSAYPPLVVVTLRSTAMGTLAVYFQTANFTAARALSIRGLNPCDDYVVKLYYYGVSTPWRIRAEGNYTPVATVTHTATVTATVTTPVTVTYTTAYTSTATATVTARETATVTQVYTVTEYVREVDPRSVFLAFLGVGMLALALIFFILADRRRRV